jgi:hypothetical protein
MLNLNLSMFEVQFLRANFSEESVQLGVMPRKILLKELSLQNHREIGSSITRLAAKSKRKSRGMITMIVMCFKTMASKISFLHTDVRCHSNKICSS